MHPVYRKIWSSLSVILAKARLLYASLNYLKIADFWQNFTIFSSKFVI